MGQAASMDTSEQDRDYRGTSFLRSTIPFWPKSDCGIPVLASNDTKKYPAVIKKICSFTPSVQQDHQKQVCCKGHWKHPCRAKV